jgi:hypothetical protein
LGEKVVGRVRPLDCELEPQTSADAHCGVTQSGVLPEAPHIFIERVEEGRRAVGLKLWRARACESVATPASRRRLVRDAVVNTLFGIFNNTGMIFYVVMVCFHGAVSLRDMIDYAARFEDSERASEEECTDGPILLSAHSFKPSSL